MKLEQYLQRIGWLKPKDNITTPMQGNHTNPIAIKEEIQNGSEISSQTVGELFDMLKACKKSMPVNLQINVPGWYGRQIEEINRLK